VLLTDGSNAGMPETGREELAGLVKGDQNLGYFASDECKE